MPTLTRMVAFLCALLSILHDDLLCSAAITHSHVDHDKPPCPVDPSLPMDVPIILTSSTYSYRHILENLLESMERVTALSDVPLLKKSILILSLDDEMHQLCFEKNLNCHRIDTTQDSKV